MAALVYETPNEKAVSGALALVMHALFAALLVFGVNWKRPEPVAMVAELWSNLPPVAAPKAPPPPPPPPKVEPEPPRPAPKVEAKPVPKVVEPKPVPKADIDLREKKEKERLAQEKALAEKKKREEQEREAAKKRAAEAEARRAAEREQAEAHKKVAAQRANEQAQALDKYKQAVAARIRRFIVEPPSLQGNPEVEFEVIQLPGGEILGIKTRKASTQTAWDNAVERAIQRAQPLPPPPDPAMFKDVRELHLKFRPKE
jgi:colicin import membrane protein